MSVYRFFENHDTSIACRMLCLARFVDRPGCAALAPPQGLDDEADLGGFAGGFDDRAKAMDPLLAKYVIGSRIGKWDLRCGSPWL